MPAARADGIGTAQQQRADHRGPHPPLRPPTAAVHHRSSDRVARTQIDFAPCGERLPEPEFRAGEVIWAHPGALRLVGSGARP